LPTRIQAADAGVTVPSFRVGARRLILAEGAEHLPAVAGDLRERSDWMPKGEEDLQEIVVAVGGETVSGAQQEVVRLGVRIVPLHRAVAEVVGLPAGWLESQKAVIGQILEPLRVGEGYKIARLRVPAENGEPEEDALAWLDRSL